MKGRHISNLIAAVLAAVVLYLGIAWPTAAEDTPPPPDPAPEAQHLIEGKTVFQWHAIAARYRRQLLHRWQPTVDYALRLASAVYGVSYWQMRSVSYCESHWYPFARNGRYLGIFQMHWQPFGFSPFDPVASALSAAATVRHDGSWRQWECKP